jgi:hypothetical protein
MELREKINNTIDNIENKMIASIGTETKPSEIYRTEIVKLFEDLAENLFDDSMHFKSDANPFSEDGECQVVDGYNHCKKSMKEYLKDIH